MVGSYFEVIILVFTMGIITSKGQTPPTNKLNYKTTYFLFDAFLHNNFITEMCLLSKNEIVYFSLFC